MTSERNNTTLVHEESGLITLPQFNSEDFMSKLHPLDTEHKTSITTGEFDDVTSEYSDSSEDSDDKDDIADNEMVYNNNNKTFQTWLKEQNLRNDPVGDVARDFCQDLQKVRLLPLRILSPTSLVTHMKSLGACRAAIRAAKEAGKEWRSQYQPDS